MCVIIFFFFFVFCILASIPRYLSFNVCTLLKYTKVLMKSFLFLIDSIFSRFHWLADCLCDDNDKLKNSYRVLKRIVFFFWKEFSTYGQVRISTFRKKTLISYCIGQKIIINLCSIRLDPVHLIPTTLLKHEVSTNVKKILLVDYLFLSFSFLLFLQNEAQRIAMCERMATSWMVPGGDDDNDYNSSVIQH